ncbi:kinase-like protein [Trichodelitschia bisporula]|uniref:Kinase-like protein n=1 Tax=Trichodelitschia bisporula TaxID=703511 RepID=A0A6G1HRG4_9PEZI|nr:kinase-like protein [Trichodelitschia bisporula]
MAREHTFHKLKLDTHASKPVNSPFRSIKRRDHDDTFTYSPHGPVVPADAVLSTDDLVNSLPDVDDARFGFDIQKSAATSSTTDHTASLRDRRTSISFAPHVTTEDGHKRSLGEPLPKQEDKPTTAALSMLDTRLPHDNRRKNGFTDHADKSDRAGRPRFVYGEIGGARIPAANDYERVASLTSATTASPRTEEIHTPLNEYLLSPISGSPGDFSPFRPGGLALRSSSQRSRRSERSGSVRHSSSRRSTRSGHPSMSPASAFLSLYSSGESAVAVEPDSEGQEIGDHTGYIIGRQIGAGGTSTVKEVYSMEAGIKVIRAVKIVRKQIRDKDERENEKAQAELEHEVDIWRYLKHRYILPLFAVYDTPFATFCITQLNRGGTLFDLMRARRRLAPADRGLPNHLAQRYTYQLAAAIRYLHEDMRVVHRDIKLENCLLDMSAPDAAAVGGNVLLCDFGMADFIHNESRIDAEASPSQSPGRSLSGSDLLSTTVVGSLEYTAPELIGLSEAVYSTAADMWSFGVVVYALLTGSRPFQHELREKLVLMLAKGEWDPRPLVEAPAVREGGAKAVELVQRCLVFEPEERWSVGRVLEIRC